MKKYIAILTLVILFGFGCTSSSQPKIEPNQRIQIVNELTEEDKVDVTNSYSGEITTLTSEECSYTQDPKFGTVTFKFPCTWIIEEESGFIRIWSPDSLAYIKYPGYYISHVDSEDTRGRTMLINGKTYTILDVYVEGNLKYSLVSPEQGDLNNVGIEDLNRDNNNILIQYSEANQETINEIIQTFDF